MRVKRHQAPDGNTMASKNSILPRTRNVKSGHHHHHHRPHHHHLFPRVLPVPLVALVVHAHLLNRNRQAIYEEEEEAEVETVKSQDDRTSPLTMKTKVQRQVHRHLKVIEIENHMRKERERAPASRRVFRVVMVARGRREVRVRRINEN